MFKRLFKRARDIPNAERVAMETALDDVFQPIIPRQQFINGLQRTLMNYTLEAEGDEVIKQQNMIVVLAGFFSAALLLSIGIRTILTFIGAIGVIQYHKRQIDRNQVTAPLKSVN